VRPADPQKGTQVELERMSLAGSRCSAPVPLRRTETQLIIPVEVRAADTRQLGRPNATAQSCDGLEKTFARMAS
jgi:hypothetical protein